MARIRTIKPEFWSSEPVSYCSSNGRLLFVGLWNFCDDYGVHPLSYRRMRLEIFPADPLTDDDVKQLVGELVENGLVRIYDVDGKSYLHVTSWFEHQRIDKPAKTRHPAPPENSPNTPGTFDECSENVPSGKGSKEGKGIGSKDASASCPELPQAAASEPAVVVLEFPTVGNGKKTWALSQAKFKEYVGSFPAVDVLAECRNALQWCRDNPTKRKTPRGMAGFLTRWLTKVQNSGGSRRGPPQQAKSKLDSMLGVSP